ncbi:hypothetical protein NFI96_013305 [Prochilodus magdalenae]|nr:hypothetical protein NFI96_013305 [Prochilodus magdalenae]
MKSVCCVMQGSDIETLGPENGADYDQEEVGRAAAPDQPASPREADAAGAAGDSSLDATLVEETAVAAEPGQQAGEGAGVEEHVTLCSSSDHSDIVTLGDSKEAEISTWEEPLAKEDGETTNEELYLGTSSSSQYTFSAAETTSSAPQDDSQSSSDTEVSSSTAVSDPLTPAPHTLTHHHHVSVTAVLRMIHHPHHTCSVVVLWGSCPLKNRVIQYTEKQMDYSLDLYTYRVSYTAAVIPLSVAAVGWLRIGRGLCRSVGRFSGHFTERLYNALSLSVQLMKPAVNESGLVMRGVCTLAICGLNRFCCFSQRVGVWLCVHWLCGVFYSMLSVCVADVVCYSMLSHAECVPGNRELITAHTPGFSVLGCWTTSDVFPAERPVRRGSISTSTEEEDGEIQTSPVVRRRRLRRSTAGSEPDEQQEVQREREELKHPHTVPADGAVGVEVEGHQVFWTCDGKPSISVLTTVPPHTDSLGVSTKTKAGLVGDGAEEEVEHREPRVFGPQQRQVSGTLNKCILLALVIAISMGFGHFYGTVQVQERHRMVEKSRVNELSETRELHQCRKEKDVVSKDVVESLREDLEDKRDMVTSLTGIMDKITKENQHLRAKEAELQAQREDLFAQLQQAKSEMESRQKHLALENRALKNTLEREEASLSALQDELRHLRAQIRELEEKGAGSDSILSENQRLKDHLMEEKQRVQSFLNQKEALMAEAQVLRKELDKERKVTDRLRDELDELTQKDPGTDRDPETEELQTRLQELEKKLSFEQQRSDLWERLYVETKEEGAKGDRQIKSRKPKDGIMGKVKETFDAVKNSTKEFVHHHKEQIKKAKEAVKENLRKFSDSVKSTFRHLKDSASTMFERSRRMQQKRSHERKDAKMEQQEFKYEEFMDQSDVHTEDTHWQHHRPLHQHPRKSTVDSSFQADHNTRKSGAQKEQATTGQRAVPKGCTGVFDCAYQESMSLFNKAMDPIRADEFNQLLHSYLQQEVGHFHHWRELESFINNFFHNGLFIHDQMLFTDFVSGVEDYLEDMDEYQGGGDEVFEDLDDYIYRHFFGDTYLKRYGPSLNILTQFLQMVRYGVEVEGHQAFWTCDDKPFILVLTTVPPHTGSLGVSTKTKVGLVTEVLRGAAVCQWCCTNRMTNGGRESVSRPLEGPRVKAEQGCQRQQRKHQHSRPLPPRDRKWARSGRSSDRHFADVKIELGPMPFDPKY